MCARVCACHSGARSDGVTEANAAYKAQPMSHRETAKAPADSIKIGGGVAATAALQGQCVWLCGCQCVFMSWTTAVCAQAVSESAKAYGNAGSRVSRFERARPVKPASSALSLSPRCDSCDCARVQLTD